MSDRWNEIITGRMRYLIKEIDTGTTEYPYFCWYYKIPQYLWEPINSGIKYYVCIKVKEGGDRTFGIKNNLCRFFATEAEANNYLFELQTEKIV